MTETLSSLPQIHALNPLPSSRRNGKIARLPKETRDMLNRMLDDGIPYHVIIDELGEVGEGLNTQNLTNWKQGGYQEWVKNQELIERSRAQTEHAIDLLRETDGAANAAKVTEACHMVGATQLMEALLDHGDDAIKKMLVDTPDTYIRILNVVCRLADSGLRYDKHNSILKQQSKPPQNVALSLSPSDGERAGMKGTSSPRVISLSPSDGEKVGLRGSGQRGCLANCPIPGKANQAQSS